MSNPLHICSTGINRLRDDSDESRTVEVEVANFDDTPVVRMKAKFRCVLVESAEHGPRLMLRDASGAIIGFISLEAAV
jgi:hypothetical protein